MFQPPAGWQHSPLASSGMPSVLPGDPDPVNHPPHYQHPSGIECIEVARHMTFNLGNALKYIWRAGRKGDAVQDLEKARWYLDDEITRLKGTAT